MTNICKTIMKLSPPANSLIYSLPICVSHKVFFVIYYIKKSNIYALPTTLCICAAV